MPYTLVVNDRPVTVDVAPDTPLLWVLRDTLNLTGTKYGCGIGQCGACMVHVDGEAQPSCLWPIDKVAGRNITTIEGLGGGGLHFVQAAWIEEQVPQCGYCQPGQIMAASALLARNPAPNDADIDVAMARNLCRCGTYQRVRRAIHTAAQGRA